MLKPSFQHATLFPQLLHFFYLSSSSSLQQKQGREGERVESPRRAKDQKIDPMKAKVMGKYESCKNNALATLSINVGQELVLKTTMTNATFVHGPSLTGLELALHKPNSFTLHCNIPRKVTSSSPIFFEIPVFISCIFVEQIYHFLLIFNLFIV